MLHRQHRSLLRTVAIQNEMKIRFASRLRPLYSSEKDIVVNLNGDVSAYGTTFTAIGYLEFGRYFHSIHDFSCGISFSFGDVVKMLKPSRKEEKTLAQSLRGVEWMMFLGVRTKPHGDYLDIHALVESEAGKVVLCPFHLLDIETPVQFSSNSLPVARRLLREFRCLRIPLGVSKDPEMWTHFNLIPGLVVCSGKPEHGEPRDFRSHCIAIGLPFQTMFFLPRLKKWSPGTSNR